MKLIKGENLTRQQVTEVKARYVNRFLAIGDGKYYRDEESWIKDHAFHVRKDGKLSNRHHRCEPAFMGD
jgi:hypothetical protein